MLIFHFLSPLTLTQMRWRCSSKKWLQLPQLCPSIIIIFLQSPVSTVSATDGGFLCFAVMNNWDRRSIFTECEMFFSSVLVRDMLEDIETLIPSFRGVKFSGSDLMDLGQCVSYSPPHWSLLYGVDEVSTFSPLVCFSPSVLHCGCLYCKMKLPLDKESKANFLSSFCSNCSQLWPWAATEPLAGQCVNLHNAWSPFTVH